MRPTALRIAEGLISSARCSARPMPRVRDKVRRLGLAYQANVKKELTKTAAENNLVLESEPWFAFTDKWGRGQAVPDFVILVDDIALIIEVKLSWVPMAGDKLLGLYAPVVGMALGRRTKLLVICKHMAPGVIAVTRSLRSAIDLNASVPTLQWLGRGGITW